MRRHSCLNQHATALRPAAGPARDLAEELEAALRRTKVGKIDADVGVDHTDQRHIWKVQSLGDHLRAEQNVDLAAADAVENLGVGPFSARRIDVHPRDARGRKTVGEKPLDLLRAEPPLAEDEPAAPGALQANGLGVLAVVADQSLGRAMIRQADRAVRTIGDVAASGALHERRIAAAIEQQNALLLLAAAGRRAPVSSSSLTTIRSQSSRPSVTQARAALFRRRLASVDRPRSPANAQRPRARAA